MNKNILKSIIKSEYSLNIFLNFLEILENNFVFLYKNWLKGKIILQPKVSRYWINILVLFDEDDEPDFSILKDLEKLNIKYKIEKISKKIYVDREINQEKTDPLTGIPDKENLLKKMEDYSFSNLILIEFSVPIYLFNKKILG